MNSSQKRAVIVHGYEADPSDHWFPWLARTLESNGFRSTVPAMPDSASPSSEAWISALRAELPTVDENTAIIGHSLGCIAALRYLKSLERPWTLGSLVLVSGFTDTLPAIPALDGFIGSGGEVSELKKGVNSIVAISSDDDPIVPPSSSADLARRLGAELIVVPEAGHFLGDGGFTELPEVLTALGLQG